MNLPTFIRLENTLEAAMLYQNSPVLRDSVALFTGVHLVPGHSYRYVQRTYALDGIEIETIICQVYSMCGKLLATLPNGDFQVLRNFNDPLTGLPQVEWSLKTNADFGNQLIYIAVYNGSNAYVYSSPFTLTVQGSEYTSRWDYRNQGQMLSTGLNIYFRKRCSRHEASTYNPVSSGYTINPTSTINPYEDWRTGIIFDDIYEEFKKIMTCRERYSLPMTFSGLPVLTGVLESLPESEEEGDENFIESDPLLLVRNYDVTFNPNAGIIIPPPPEPTYPEITLASAIRLNNNQVRLNFTVANFIPAYLYYGFSENGLTWSEVGSNPDSPHVLNVPNNNTIDYYYRVRHELATSNSVQIPMLLINLQTVEYLGDLKYSLGYSVIGTEVAEGDFLDFEISADGLNFRPGFYAQGNENPKEIEMPFGVSDSPYFRIRYEELNLTSNIVQFIPA